MSVVIDGTGTSTFPAASVSGNATVSGTLGGATITEGGVSVPRMALSTAQNTTSGTSIDFTSIPSWVKKITVMFNGVSTNGTSNLLVQLGAGSVQTTGYNAVGGFTQTTANSIASSQGFIIWNVAAANTIYGSLILTTSGSNVWNCVGHLYSSTGAYLLGVAGNVPLSGTLDRLRYTTVSGSDSFDAGSVNTLYEG